MPTPIVSTPITYEPKVGAPYDRRSVFDTFSTLQNYDKAFLYNGWVGYVKNNNYHPNTPGYMMTYDGTSFTGITSDTVDGKHAYGTPVGDFGTMVDPTNLVEYISVLRSMIINLDNTDDLPEGVTNLHYGVTTQTGGARVNSFK